MDSVGFKKEKKKATRTFSIFCDSSTVHFYPVIVEYSWSYSLSVSGQENICMDILKNNTAMYNAENL